MQINVERGKCRSAASPFCRVFNQRVARHKSNSHQKQSEAYQKFRNFNGCAVRGLGLAARVAENQQHAVHSRATVIACVCVCVRKHSYFNLVFEYSLTWLLLFLFSCLFAYALQHYAPPPPSLYLTNLPAHTLHSYVNNSHALAAFLPAKMI